MPPKDLKPSRVTTVLVPGEQQKPAVNLDIDKTADTGNTYGASLPGDPAGANVAALPAAAPTLDIEALRAQIRAEERDKARAELGQQIQAAASVVAKPATTGIPQRAKADYRNMRANDIDPASLTAPVMTLDGYLCPPAPEAKK